MSRGRSLALWLVIVALVIAAAFWVSLRAYGKYEAHRAVSLLTEASRVRIGDTEASVLAFVKRYDGYKWTPTPLSPRENWIDQDEYDYQVKRLSDYQYELGIAPFGTTILNTGRFTQTMRGLRETVPRYLRPALGFRDWGTVVVFSIRKGRVQSVSAMTLVEGRSEWLGHKWELAESMPRHDMPTRAYLIGAANLTMGDGVGTMIKNVVTTKASEEEFESARKFNTECLTSIRGCDGLCHFAPRALENLRLHPDATWNIIPPKCD